MRFLDYASLVPLGLPGIVVAVALIQFWLRGFALLGRPCPYHVAEDFEAALVRLGAAFTKRRGSYELTFDDTPENRLKVLRFLFSNHFADLPRREVLDFFTPHAENGRVVVRTGHTQFAVRRD